MCRKCAANTLKPPARACPHCAAAPIELCPAPFAEQLLNMLPGGMPCAPCGHKGCPEMLLPLDKLADHRRACPALPIRCAMCQWTGAFGLPYQEHLINDHHRTRYMPSLTLDAQHPAREFLLEHGIQVVVNGDGRCSCFVLDNSAEARAVDIHVVGKDALGVIYDLHYVVPAQVRRPGDPDMAPQRVEFPLRVHDGLPLPTARGLRVSFSPVGGSGAAAAALAVAKVVVDLAEEEEEEEFEPPKKRPRKEMTQEQRARKRDTDAKRRAARLAARDAMHANNMSVVEEEGDEASTD